MAKRKDYRCTSSACGTGHGPPCEVCEAGHYRERNIVEVGGHHLCWWCLHWFSRHPVGECVRERALMLLGQNLEAMLAPVSGEYVRRLDPRDALLQALADNRREQELFGFVGARERLEILLWLEARDPHRGVVQCEEDGAALLAASGRSSTISSVAAVKPRGST